MILKSHYILVTSIAQIKCNTQKMTTYIASMIALRVADGLIALAANSSFGWK